jgi:2-(1,2-epoxy-1,2-dihydrophenyl)acetyl-CoA isomerase
MSYETILLEEADGIATLTLNRPASLNAITMGMGAELNAALDDLRDKGTARVLLMTGAGRAFCSGFDLASVQSPEAHTIDAGAFLESTLNPLVERLFALPIPVVTAINGLAAGAGCSIALCGDIVFAARSSYLLLAFVNIGLVPDMGATWIVPRLAGRARAQAMMMLGERIPAEQAESWGTRIPSGCGSYARP